MKRTLLLLVIGLVCMRSNAQKVSNIDFDAVKKSLDNSPKMYTGLLERFRQADSTLTNDEYKLIYYGQCFQKSYNPYGNDQKNFDSFKKYYQDEKFEQALPFALKMIDNNPLNMKMTFLALVCYHHINDVAGKANMSSRYNGIMKTIFDSGDGKSDPTAFVVMCINDEYELMANMQVQNTSQALRGFCDVMTLKENDLGIKELYFNVSKPLESMMNMFKK